ncbi:MAG TPA: gluconeogenesis factor YvcK family protein [Candidatus Nanoarchaeia archaeon]|nr:gluconeogenesis factor YvcK family protein [Candidatus Nanoarchaeia archaeon]
MKKIVVIGGGTGSFTVLTGLKNFEVDLSAIVSMADDGGSTGILRDELGVLPPGDVRQCLVALSNSSRLMRSMMNYRFENGGLGGHNFGNIFLSTLEKVTGSFEKAIEEAGKILSIKGKVLPVTTNPVRLHMMLDNDKLLLGEREILLSKESLIGFKNIYLEPFPKANPHALDEIMNADLIVFGPGGLYTSLIPNLLVDGVSKALRETKAKKVFILNLMNKRVQTPGFKASNYLSEIKRFIGKDVFDFILLNNRKPASELIAVYSLESEFVENDIGTDARVTATDLISNEKSEYSKGDAISSTRALIRHDPKKIAEEIIKILNVI